MRPSAFISLIVTLPFIALSCNNAIGPIAGIAITVENGRIIQDDPDDWQPRRTQGAGDIVALTTAFPNPTTGGCGIGVDCLEDLRRVHINIVDERHRRVRVLVHDYSIWKGSHTFYWDLREDDGNRVSPGLYRMHLGFESDADLPRPLATYGDIQVREE